MSGPKAERKEQGDPTDEATRNGGDTERQRESRSRELHFVLDPATDRGPVEIKE